MKRRDFIQISSLSLAALLVDGCSLAEQYDITFLNDMAVGHLSFESHKFPFTKEVKTKYLIVGGGIAGMSAAYQLRQEDFMLFELSDLLGGSSAGSIHNNLLLCHGAHYDLTYPSNFGKEVLSMLKELRIIKYDQFSNSWKFVDKQFHIPKNQESQTWAYGNFRKDVLPEGPIKVEFIELMKSFSGNMLMPTRLINVAYHYLNTITFLEWLKQHISLSTEFIEGLDYHMKDDYGAGASKVSALAGIHYYACRPYYTKPVDLFSPPEGNFYFIKKIHEKLPKEKIITNHLVKLIHEKNDGFEVEIIDASKREVIKLSCEKIIYAGHKHSLKYIFPKDFHLFQQNEYAPWVVINFVMKTSALSGREEKANQVYWQNEILSAVKSLLGFVDSKAQFSANDSGRVFTVYYCFKPQEREMMSLIGERKQIFINNTLNHLNSYFNKSLNTHVEKVFIKQMGHGMPIPKQSYLFNDANERRSNPNMVYAGVDNGRLPLLFEALDSGIAACKDLGNR